MSFKVGDCVKVSKKTNWAGWVPQMDKMVGSTCMVLEGPKQNTWNQSEGQMYKIKQFLVDNPITYWFLEKHLEKSDTVIKNTWVKPEKIEWQAVSSFESPNSYFYVTPTVGYLVTRSQTVASMCYIPRPYCCGAAEIGGFVAGSYNIQRSDGGFGLKDRFDPSVDHCKLLLHAAVKQAMRSRMGKVHCNLVKKDGRDLWRQAIEEFGFIRETEAWDNPNHPGHMIEEYAYYTKEYKGG